MSLLVQPTLDTSLAGKQQRVANRMRMASFSVFNQMGWAPQQFYCSIWANPMGLMSQQVIRVFGTNAARLFNIYTILLFNAVRAATLQAISA
jgi:hypothetical protein